MVRLPLVPRLGRCNKKAFQDYRKKKSEGFQKKRSGKPKLLNSVLIGLKVTVNVLQYLLIFNFFIFAISRAIIWLIRFDSNFYNLSMRFNSRLILIKFFITVVRRARYFLNNSNRRVCLLFNLF